MIDVGKALCDCAYNFIKWPTRENIPRIEQEFRLMAGHPGVIGVVDGCHIPISAPKENPQSYVNRKGYYSINTMAICDSKMNFTYVYVACCGSLHDARVWDLSDISEEINRHYDNFFPNETHILGDAAYSLKPYLLTGYRNDGHLQGFRRYYNTLHAKTRVIIEQAFALLVGRFRRLKYLYLENVEYASLIILSCCCLHNICLSFNDLMNVENVEDNDNDLGRGNPNIPFDVNLKRDIIANALFANR